MCKYWTDYPIQELGDTPGNEAPIRECIPISYDGNKYCRVVVNGIETSFKSGYIYKSYGRSGNVKTITKKELSNLPYIYPS